MNIEFAPREFCFKCTYQDALLYCFSLNIDGKIGWRLPSILDFPSGGYGDLTFNYGGVWFCESIPRNRKFTCVPVRDII